MPYKLSHNPDFPRYAAIYPEGGAGANPPVFQVYGEGAERFANLRLTELNAPADPAGKLAAIKAVLDASGKNYGTDIWNRTDQDRLQILFAALSDIDAIIDPEGHYGG